jgi:2-polyprenyl-3-methyl-5-hydroxy-6-metoxy-1,4-benzoquinol methylase
MNSDSHYSYTVYADPVTARTFDARRFGGPIGELIASTQARMLLEFVGNVRGRSVLDVGTGTGRAALLLAKRGATVTGVDPSEEMLAVARQRAAAAGAAISFRPGDAHALDFPDRSFDVVVSLRVLMHTPDWRTCLAELCRVSGRLLVIDYPSARSAALMESTARRVGHAFGMRTEPYRVFLDRQLIGVLATAGFRVRAIHRQFVVPIAVHKLLGSRRLTESVEYLLRRAGLRSLFGSPVTLLAERCGSS